MTGFHPAARVRGLHATWCGPCQRIGPTFVKMAEDFPDCVFIKVDVDENEVCGHLPLLAPVRAAQPWTARVVCVKPVSWTCSRQRGKRVLHVLTATCNDSPCRRHQRRAASSACLPSSFTKTAKKWTRCLEPTPTSSRSWSRRTSEEEGPRCIGPSLNQGGHECMLFVGPNYNCARLCACA